MLAFNQLSYWEKETYLNATDFLIVGSGIVGLSTAIHLKERYPTKKVTLIERGYLPTGASTKNAGFACIGSPSELIDDLTHMDESTVFNTVEKRWKGLNYVLELVGRDRIEFVQNGSYEIFRSKENEQFLSCVDQLDFLNEKLFGITGIPNVFKIDSHICKNANFQSFNNAISHVAEGQLNTGKLVQALVEIAVSKSIHILTGIEAISHSKHTLTTNKGEIRFLQMAICTNGFFKQLHPTEDVQPARAQVLITKPLKKVPFKGIYHFDKGYYYFRNVGNRILFGGGRNLDFKGETTTEIENTTQIINELQRLLKTSILPTSPFEIDYTWAGIMGVGKNKKPLVKQLTETTFCGVKLGGMGVAIGTLIGKELAEKMANS